MDFLERPVGGDVASLALGEDVRVIVIVMRSTAILRMVVKVDIFFHLNFDYSSIALIV